MTNASEPGHGDSPAAWTAVAVMLLGFAVGTVALFLEFTYPMELTWLIWVGAGLVVLGLILGFVLARLGYGVKGPKYAPKSHS
ncbi:HGxxPAAW family protein [Naasia sp. SYSU D00948]|uniref:HGxxPAAW family protein n=1 Tax=Naasia sp. SYSU D00948 TaxID=2817379 RepID=UPI001B30410C|nr:HGxxPAAW family protein [Naasia sp. SYSU D00948]